MAAEMPMASTSTQRLRELAEDSRKELERVQRELKEIDILVRQSIREVDRLAQRDSQIAQQLRQLEANLESYSREEIKTTYDAAREAQMRLFMMRNQVEQLQNKQENLMRYSQQLRRFLDLASQLPNRSEEEKKALEEPSEKAPMRNIIRIIEAQESERQRLARLIHDGPAQSLTNLILQAEICERLFDADLSKARTELANLKNAVATTFQKTRDFIIMLRPMMLDDLGLLATLRRYVEDFEKKTGISANLVATGQERRYPPYFEVTIFRVIQEALSNVAQHAQASHVRVALDFQDNQVTANVEDDGSGFDVAAVLAGPRQQASLGLISMQERAEMLGGTLEIESNVGRGTRVKLTLPSDLGSGLIL